MKYWYTKRLSKKRYWFWAVLVLAILCVMVFSSESSSEAFSADRQRVMVDNFEYVSND